MSQIDFYGTIGHQCTVMFFVYLPISDQKNFQSWKQLECLLRLCIPDRHLTMRSTYKQANMERPMSYLHGNPALAKLI